MQSLNKILLSTFTIVAFTSYAAYLHGQVLGTQATDSLAAATTTTQVSAPAAATPSASVVTQAATSPQTPSTVPTAPTVAVATAEPAPASTPAPATQPAAQPQPAIVSSGAFRDGTYTGTSVDVYYGYLQVQAVISGGKLTDVQILSYPNDRRDSIEINNYALPRLKQQAIAAQSAKIHGVSGATDTTYGFVQSLAAALSQAS